MSSGKLKESGQIIILVVVGLIGLLGFTSLAIDGGTILADRRYEQTLADSASFAGAEYLAENLQNTDTLECNSTIDTLIGTATGMAIQSVRDNTEDNFWDGSPLPDGNSVSVTCKTTPEPIITVSVAITRSVNTAFAHLFYSGEIANTVQSVVEYHAPHDLGMGNTIVALHDVCEPSVKEGVTFTGTSLVDITIGGVWSNACINAVGDSLVVTVDYGEINYNENSTYKESGTPTVDPDPQKTADKIEIEEMDPVACNNESADSYNSFKTNGSPAHDTINPGNYSDITVLQKSHTLIMNPGLYCLTGNFKVTGGSVVGDGVTIYLKQDKQIANVIIGGRAGDPKNTELGTIILSAPDTDCNLNTTPQCPPAIAGLLIYMDQNNPGEISLQGDATSEFNGVVYAPTGSIDLGGNSNTTTTMGIQAIGDTVKIHGTVQMDLHLSTDVIFLTDPYIDQTQ